MLESWIRKAPPPIGAPIGQPSFPWVAAAVTAALAFLVFIRVAGADFVFWDDDISIYNNPRLGPLSLDRLRWIVTDVDSTMRYIPLTLLSWSVTYSLAKLSPFAYHLGNLLLHAANTALLFWVLRWLLPAGMTVSSPAPDGRRPARRQSQITWAAAMGALVWAVHPLRVEPVAWANARSYNLAVFFLLLSLATYLGAHRGAGESRGWVLALSVFCFACSLLSHPIGWSFFLVLLVLDIYPLGRLGGAEKFRWTCLRPMILEKLPFAVVAFGVATVTLSVRLASAGIWHKPIGMAEFSLLERVMQAFYVWAYYLWRPWYPIDLAPAYTTLISFDPLAPRFLVSATLVIGLTLVLVHLRQRWPLGLTLWICHLLLLLPVLGLMESPHFTCDRYALAQGIVWVALVAAFLAKVPSAKRVPGMLALGVAIAVVVGLAAMSVRQTRVWDNSTALFEHMIRVLPPDHPWVSNVHRRLGQVHRWADRFEQARASWEQAIRINPDDSVTQGMLGVALAQRGRFKEALPPLQQVVRLKPNSALARLQLGSVLLMLGHLGQAQHELEEGLRLEPQDKSIADVLREVGRAKAASTGER